MKVTCVICSDYLDDQNNITCTPCGHVFHEICALQWLEHSRTCPQCRQQCTEKKLHKIYLNYCTDKQLSTDAILNELSTIKANLRVKDMEIRKLQDDLSSMKCATIKAEEETSVLQQKYYSASSQVQTLKLQLKEAIKEQKFMKQITHENAELTKKLNNLKNIENIVKGSQEDVDEVMASCWQGSENIKHVATYLAIMKKEFSSCKEAKQSLQGEVIRLKKEIGFQKMNLITKDSTISSLKNDLHCLTEKLERLEIEQESVNLRPLGERSFQSSAVMSPANENVPTPPIKKPKINMVQSFVFKMKEREFNATKNSMRKRFDDDDDDEESSNVRQGFDGLGGHSKLVSRSVPIQVKITKKHRNTENKQKTTLRTMNFV